MKNIIKRFPFFLFLCLTHTLFIQLKNPEVEGAYFYVKEGVDKCFVENITTNVVLTTTYDNFDLKDVICLITIKNESGRVLYSHDTSKIRKGKMSYLSKHEGLHYICVSCPSTNWFKSNLIKWKLSVEVGGGTDIDLKNVATKSQLSQTLNILEGLQSKFTSMKYQQTYQKNLANDMYTYNELVRKKMFFCYIMEIVLLVTVTIYSIIHLKNYFKSQKLM